MPVCPEVAGGLTTPRTRSRNHGPHPEAAACSRAAGHRCDGARSSAAPRGGRRACAANGIRVAILKDGSPSCGSRSIYDGTFSGRRISGHGLTAARLARGGRHLPRDQIEAARHEALEA